MLQNACATISNVDMPATHHTAASPKQVKFQSDHPLQDIIIPCLDIGKCLASRFVFANDSQCSDSLKQARKSNEP